MIIIALYTNLERIAQVNQDELEMWFIDRAAEGYDLRDLYYHSGASHLAAFPLATQLTPNCIYRYQSIDAIEVVEEVWAQALEFLDFYGSWKKRQEFKDFYRAVKAGLDIPIALHGDGADYVRYNIEDWDASFLPSEYISKFIDAFSNVLYRAATENGIVVISKSDNGS